MSELELYPPYITLAHIFNAPPGWGIKHRIMKEHVLQYVLDGAADYPVEDNTYHTVKGDLLYHRPGEAHAIHTFPGKSYICLSLVFHFGQADCPLKPHLEGRHLLGNFAAHPLEQRLTNLVAHYRQPDIRSRTLCQGLLLQVLAEAAEAVQQHTTQTRLTDKSRSNLILVKNYLHAHFRDPITLEDLEAISGLSKNYMVSQFRRLFDMTPIQYQIQLRANRAKELAIQSNLSISEIASEVGYADIHSFGKMFKKMTGTSLSQFVSAIVR